MTEKLLLLSDPSLTEGIKTAEQDCPELRVLSASVRPRDCGPRAPLPRGFSTAPLCRGCCAVLQGASRHRGPFCRGCGALFVGGGLPTQGLSPRPLRLLCCGGLYLEPPASSRTPPFRLQVQTKVKNKFENKKFTKLVENRTRSK